MLKKAKYKYFPTLKKNVISNKPLGEYPYYFYLPLK